MAFIEGGQLLAVKHVAWACSVRAVLTTLMVDVAGESLSVKVEVVPELQGLPFPEMKGDDTTKFGFQYQIQKACRILADSKLGQNRFSAGTLHCLVLSANGFRTRRPVTYPIRVSQVCRPIGCEPGL